MNFLGLNSLATRGLGQLAKTRRRVNANRAEVRAKKLVKQLPSQFMFVLALLGAVGQVAALPLLACEMMVTPAGALNCHLVMRASAPLDQLDHLSHSDSSFSATSHAGAHSASLANQAQTHSSERGVEQPSEVADTAKLADLPHTADGHAGLPLVDQDCDSCLSCSVVSSINPQGLNRPDSPALMRESYLAPTLSNSLENLFRPPIAA